ncbi:MAG: TolC family protein [Calditrichaceae bacterium]
MAATDSEDFNIKQGKIIMIHSRKSGFCLWLLFVLFFLPRFSTADDSEKQLRLGEAIQLALEQNISLRISSNSVSGAKIDVNQSRMEFLPNVSASLSSSKDFPKTGNENESVNASVSSGLNLFNGFYDISRLNKAGLDLAAEEAGYNRSRESVVFETISRFVQVVLNNEFIGIEKNNLEAQMIQLKQIEEFRKAGNRSKADVYQQLADIKQNELNVLNAASEYEVSRNLLSRTLGIQLNDDMKFLAPEIDLITQKITSSGPDQETFQMEVNSRRFDLRAQQLNIESGTEQIRAAKSGYWPSVSLTASAGSNYSGSVQGYSFSDQLFDENPYVRLGLSVSVPLFDRFYTKYNVQQANIQLSTQKMMLEDLKLEINNEIRQAMFDYKSALKQKELAQARKEYALEALKISEERYRVGSSTYVEMSQVRASYVTAAYQKVSADYNLLLKYAAVYYYGGNIDEVITLFN